MVVAVRIFELSAGLIMELPDLRDLVIRIGYSATAKRAEDVDLAVVEALLLPDS